MKTEKFCISELGIFKDAVCTDCLNDDEEDKLCSILGELAASGECDMVYHLDVIDKETGCFNKCMMRRTDEENTISGIVEWIDKARTEEVECVLKKIEGSYHYDVIKGQHHE